MKRRGFLVSAGALALVTSSPLQARAGKVSDVAWREAWLSAADRHPGAEITLGADATRVRRLCNLAGQLVGCSYSPEYLLRLFAGIQSEVVGKLPAAAARDDYIVSLLVVERLAYGPAPRGLAPLRRTPSESDAAEVIAEATSPFGRRRR